MLAVRGVSIDEFIILTARGVVSSETAPWAPIQPGERCDDTAPPPPPGTICLFDLSAITNQLRRELLLQTVELWFGYALIFDVPDSAITWRGTGTYWFRDMWCDDDWKSTTYPEIGVRELRRDWLIAQSAILTKYLSEELGYWADWDRWRTMSPAELDNFLDCTIFVERRTDEARAALRDLWLCMFNR